MQSRMRGDVAALPSDADLVLVLALPVGVPMGWQEAFLIETVTRVCSLLAAGPRTPNRLSRGLRFDMLSMFGLSIH